MAVVGLYCVAMNVFVGTRMFRSAISYAPDSLLVEYTRAYSLVPGHIHVEGLRIRGRDSHVEWLLSIDRCDFKVTFADLLRRRFHARDVEGDGLSLVLRRRQDRITAEAMTATPRIVGFLDPPLSDVGPPLAPLTDEKYNLWSIFLDRVRARHVREIWIDTVRYTGDLTVLGSWFFRPIRWLEVGPATVEMHPLNVSFGEVEPWLTGVEGTLGVAVHPTDLVATPAARMVGRVSVHGAAKGALDLDNVMERLAPEEQWAPAVARFEARFDLDHGVVKPETSARLEPFDVRVLSSGYVVAARTGVRVSVDEHGSASAEVDAAAVRVERRATVLVRASKLSVRAVTRSLDLACLPTDSPRKALHALGVDAPAIDVPSLPALAAAMRLPEGLSIEGGSGRAALSVRATAKGDALDVSGTSLTYRADGASAAGGWWGGVELVQATLSDLGSPRLSARVALRAKDASPLAAFVVSKIPVPRSVVDAVSTNDLQATADLFVSPSVVEARSVRAHCSGMDGRFEYVVRHGDAGWALWLDLGLVRVAAYTQGGSTQVALFDTEPWYEQRVVRLRAVE